MAEKLTGNCVYPYEVHKGLYKRSGRSPFNIFLNAIIVLFCVILILEVVFNILFMGIYVVNVSMQPTLIGARSENTRGGEFIYVDKHASPDYGDIVIVYREVSYGGHTEKGNIIKRAMAFGGDTVKMEKGILYVNGNAVKEDYLVYNDPELSVNSFEERTVKEGCMFLLGDNRNESTDSRQNGDYPVKNLVGVVPDWAMSVKSFTTAMYTFFNFTLWGK